MFTIPPCDAYGSIRQNKQAPFTEWEEEAMQEERVSDWETEFVFLDIGHTVRG